VALALPVCRMALALPVRVHAGFPSIGTRGHEPATHNDDDRAPKDDERRECFRNSSHRQPDSLFIAASLKRGHQIERVEIAAPIPIARTPAGIADAG
jgi:hypothetical protein